jgi:hypothetical protein
MLPQGRLLLGLLLGPEPVQLLDRQDLQQMGG